MSPPVTGGSESTGSILVVGVCVRRQHSPAPKGSEGLSRTGSGGPLSPKRQATGTAGGQHHHRINMDKYHPGYFGKVGMRYYHKTNNKSFRPVLNLDKVAGLADKSHIEVADKGGKKVAVVVDTLKAGFGKVLAKGRLSRPYIVKARSVSRRAEKKIVEAGGKVELVA
ncbi:60S ribosomal protein L28 [Gonapodya sp. JEL0774]|nr:60S ribosomal protein L28 [Gonapodya sp. JEL0774]